jgi:DNA polymerase epsilon subunit 1
LKVTEDQELTLKNILDWDYYFDRFVTIVQKIITIPAILQNVENPIPEIPCPDWLNKKVFD